MSGLTKTVSLIVGWIVIALVELDESSEPQPTNNRNKHRGENFNKCIHKPYK